MRKKVLVAMSGGVDSSVASFLLKQHNFDVVGVTMCLGVRDETPYTDKPGCCGVQAIEDARRVCEKLGIGHYVLDFSKYLKEKVIDRFVSDYGKGRTPNPCVECNRYLKFEILLNKARSLGFDFLATGHYAKIEKNKNGFVLKRARDKTKDQSYFLYPIKKDKLKYIKFPLADLTKTQVRSIAHKAGLAVSEKPASQDICFISGKNYHAFLSPRIKKPAPGPIVDTQGNILGRHKGIYFYTIGQRRGLSISSSKPLYVVKVNVKKNELIVSDKKDLKAKNLVAGKVNLLVKKLPHNALAKIRYGHKAARCTVLEKGKKLYISFTRPQESITPGQSVVLYDKSTVAGGAIIEKVL